jgi:predicted urease superfamily metal-dependent hydrolase
MATKCAHIKANKERCGGYAVSKSKYCFAHDPAQASKRRNAQRKGGEAGRVATLPESSLSVRKMSDVLELMETTINDVRTGRLDVKVANAIGYLANVSVKVIQQTDIEARLEALESVLEPEHATMVQRRRAA